MHSCVEKPSSEIFAIHGGGNIGLGLMADVVSKSRKPWRIIATSNDTLVKKIVNSTNQLWIKHRSTRCQTHIRNITIISRNLDDIVSLYRTASILAICLTPHAFNNSITAITKGLIERYRMSQAPLKILVLMNYPDCATRVRNQINSEINALLKDKKTKDAINQMVQYIPTVADRMVSKIPEQDVIKQLKNEILSTLTTDYIEEKWLEKKIDSLIQDQNKLALVISRMNFKLNLFDAEKHFSLYAPKLQEISQFRDIQCVENVRQVEDIKNKFINGPHAMLAWLGALFGCKTIAESIRFPGIKNFLNTVMDEEIAPVLMKAWPDLQREELDLQKTVFMKRCEESVDDSVYRAGRDPLRKINTGERIRGTIELAKQQGNSGSITGLCYGIAAAILYALKKCDPKHPECRQIRKIYKKNYLSQDILTWSGSEGNIQFSGFDPVQDKVLVDRVIQCISTLEQQCKKKGEGDNFIFCMKNLATFGRSVRIHSASISCRSLLS